MIRTITLMLLLSWCAFLRGQSIRLIDQQQRNPINHAFFSYGKTHGLSDNAGTINIVNDSVSSLMLSHLNYGERIISADELSAFLKSGTITWKKLNYELQPISIIALHQYFNDSLPSIIKNENKLSHDAAAVLAQLPEIGLIRKSGSYGFDPVLRGFKYDQLNIVMDGAQSANAACPNRMDPPSSQMPVNMLSQISVLKGPYSLRWGSAIGGTINFQTSPLRFNQPQDFTGRLSNRYESNGQIWRSEGLISFNTETLVWKLFGSISNGNNYCDGDGNEVASSFYRNNFGSTIGLQLSDNQNLKLNISHNYAKNVDFPALAMDLRKDDTWMGSLHHSISFHRHLKEWKTSIYTTRVDHLMDNYDKIIEPRMIDAVTDAQTSNFGGRTEGQWLFGSNQLYLGFDYRGDNADGERARTFLMGPNTGNTVLDNVWQEAFVNKYGIFGEFQHQLNLWHMVYAGRLEYNSADANNPDDTFNELYDDLKSTAINPGFSVGISRHLSPHLKTQLWLGHSQRSASLSERYINFLPVGLDPYEMVGNPELKSEKNQQADLVLSYTNDKTQIKLSGFMSAVHDFISAEIRDDLSPKMASAPGVKQFKNINKATLKGFEATWAQSLTAFMNHRLSLAHTIGKNADTGEALPEIPPLDIRYEVDAHLLHNKLQPSFVIRYVAQQNRIAESFGETSTPAFTLVDFAIDYISNSFIDVQAEATNLFDQNYYEHLTRSVRGSSEPIYAPGRSITITLIAHW